MISNLTEHTIEVFTLLLRLKRKTLLLCYDVDGDDIDSVCDTGKLFLQSKPTYKWTWEKW